MRPLDIDYDVVELKAGDFRDPKATATGQANDDTVPSVVARSAGPGRQVSQDGCKFTTAQ
jgi:hypothetical protein